MEKQILIVDDSASIRELLIFTLEKAGYKVIAAINGQDALKQLNGKKEIDLIITDLHMPIMDGLDLIKKVRNLDNYKYLPILFLTTESQVAKKDEARDAGATGWIVKPFSPEKLLAAITKLVR